MVTLARFVIRPTDDGRGDLILGAMFKEQRPDLLGPGQVYEIRDTLGALTVVPVGPTVIGRNAQDTLLRGVHWLGTPDHILTSGNAFVLTRDEFLAPRLVG